MMTSSGEFPRFFDDPTPIEYPSEQVFGKAKEGSLLPPETFSGPRLGSSESYQYRRSRRLDRPTAAERDDPNDWTSQLWEYIDLIKSNDKRLGDTVDDLVAIKILKLDASSHFDERERMEVCEILKTLNDKAITGVIKCLGFFIFKSQGNGQGDDIRYLAVVMEYFGKGLSLRKIHEINRKERKHLEIKHVKNILRSLLQTVAQVHAQNIVHCDLHPANILLRNPDYRNEEQNDFLRVIDFNTAHRLNDLRIAGCSTKPYCVPGQMMMTVDDFYLDVHALGVILLEMLGCNILQHDDEVLDIYTQYIYYDRKKGSVMAAVGADNASDEELEKRPLKYFDNWSRQSTIIQKIIRKSNGTAQWELSMQKRLDEIAQNALVSPETRIYKNGGDMLKALEDALQNTQKPGFWQQIGKFGIWPRNPQYVAAGPSGPVAAGIEPDKEYPPNPISMSAEENRGGFSNHAEPRVTKAESSSHGNSRTEKNSRNNVGNIYNWGTIGPGYKPRFNSDSPVAIISLIVTIIGVIITLVASYCWPFHTLQVREVSNGQMKPVPDAEVGLYVRTNRGELVLEPPEHRTKADGDVTGLVAFRQKTFEVNVKIGGEKIHEETITFNYGWFNKTTRIVIKRKDSALPQKTPTRGTGQKASAIQRNNTRILAGTFTGNSVPLSPLEPVAAPVPDYAKELEKEFEDLLKSRRSENPWMGLGSGNRVKVTVRGFDIEPNSTRTKYYINELSVDVELLDQRGSQICNAICKLDDHSVVAPNRSEAEKMLQRYYANEMRSEAFIKGIINELHSRL